MDRLSIKIKEGDLLRGCLETLADAYVLSFKHNYSKFNHLAAAISIYRILIRHVSAKSFDLPRILNSLGCALHLRYTSHQEQDLEDITEAISHLRRALDVAPEISSTNILRLILVNFGSACRQLCYRTFDPELFSQGIFALQRALEMTPVGDTEFPHRLKDLANCFLQRFLHLKDTEDLLQAIKFQERAIEITSVHDLSLPEFMADLGRAQRQLYEVTQDPRDLSNAISTHRKAIECSQRFQDGMFDKYDLFLQFGESLRVRFWFFSAQEDFDEAESALKKALALTPERHHGRSDVLGVIALLHTARGLKAMRGHTIAESTLMGMISSLEMSSASSSSPTTRMMMASLQGLFQKHAAGNLNDRQGLAAYATAINIFPEIAGLEQRVEVRHQQLMQMKSFVLLGVARAIELEELSMAVEWMERMRCWIWNQISQLRAPLDDVRAHNEELAARMEQITQQLEVAGSRSTIGRQQVYTATCDIPWQEESHQHVRLVKEWNQTIEEVRAMPELKDFLQPPKIANLLGGIPDEGPVILLNVDFRQCDAIALLAKSDEPILIPLTAKEKELQGLCLQLQRYLSFKGMRSRGAAQDLNEDVGIDSKERGGRPRPSAPATVLADILSYLWTRIVKPVLDALAYSVRPSHNTCRRIWWCTTGPLAFLPLHAAGIYGDKTCCLSDYAISSYIPTVTTLIEKIQKTSKRPNRLLLVGQADVPGFTPIPATLEEITAVAACVQDTGEVTILQGVDATTDAVKNNISSYGSIHLACHGIQQMGEPLKSGFELRGGRLDLLEIIKQHNSEADFAFLSACQTSAGDENSPEEVVHLAAGMLAAGYRSVVATSWSIKDAYGPEVAKNFYGRLMEGCTELEGTRSAIALHSAVQQLRRKVRDTEAGLLTWVPYVHFGA
ncbi:CHAT domain-containing protein [Crepidotus variabilis]|uniref:CHAT domain-containing protein n=1 Tax=Crepidotus variabilis TaxID=179855 RepID=A0A9P6EI24_9AGAR|nr:CHAT domain-containing protein [Crepidotus variabilis]